MQQLKDSEILARLIYRAFIGPAAPGETDGVITFPMALGLHARVAARETALETLRTMPAQEGGFGGPARLVALADDAPAPKKSETGLRGLNGGRCTDEKREIYARLMAFVAAHGLGARRKIAEASGGKLTLTDVQDMTDAKQVDIKKWREANAAMTIIEETEDMEESNGKDN